MVQTEACHISASLKSHGFSTLLSTAATSTSCYRSSRSTIGEGGDTNIPSPGRSSKQSDPGIGLHDPLHTRQACPEFNSFHQGVGQICPRKGLYS